MRGEYKENALDTLAVGDLADRERRVDAVVIARDADPFEGLIRSRLPSITLTSTRTVSPGPNAGIS